MWAYFLDVANWFLARAIDSATVGRDVLPAAAGWFGLALVVAAPVAVGWMWVSARRRDRAAPPPLDLLESDPWLAEDTTQTRVMRKPSPAALRGGVYHGAAVDDPDETQILGVAATAVIPRVRPVGYRGDRRG